MRRDACNAALSAALLAALHAALLAALSAALHAALSAALLAALSAALLAALSAALSAALHAALLAALLAALSAALSAALHAALHAALLAALSAALLAALHAALHAALLAALHAALHAALLAALQSEASESFHSFFGLPSGSNHLNFFREAMNRSTFGRFFSFANSRFQTFQHAASHLFLSSLNQTGKVPSSSTFRDQSALLDENVPSFGVISMRTKSRFSRLSSFQPDFVTRSSCEAVLPS